jgi:signal peptidase I
MSESNGTVFEARTLPAAPVHRARVRPFTVVLSVLAGVAAFGYFNFQSMEVEGRSMEPTLWNGQRMLITKGFWLFGDAHRGDVVILRDADDPDSSLLVKRLMFEDGDPVPSELAPRGVPFRIPPGYVFVVGDNRMDSVDSRIFGVIPRSRIVGKVVRW